MARMVVRGRPVRDSGGAGMKFPELIIMCVIIGAVVLGVRAYLIQKASASAAVANFFEAVKTGNVQNQYDLVSDDDKKMWCPDAHTYRTVFKAAEGFVERIQSVSCGGEIIDPKDPNTVTVPTTIAIRAPSEGKELWQGGTSKSVTDTFTLKKDDKGQWKIDLMASMQSAPNGMLNILGAQPDGPTQ